MRPETLGMTATQCRWRGNTRERHIACDVRAVRGDKSSAWERRVCTFALVSR